MFYFLSSNIWEQSGYCIDNNFSHANLVLNYKYGRTPDVNYF